MRTWSEEDPKAELMTRKRAQLVEAATRAFLESGYAEASVNRIAADAGVSIKTLYRHFDNKDDLFKAVMQTACGPDEGTPADEDRLLAWLALPPDQAIPAMGQDYLGRCLEPGQLALYRVIVRDAARFPELGVRYHDQVVLRRDRVFSAYVQTWASRMGWAAPDPVAVSRVYASLLRTGLFEDVVLGIRHAQPADIEAQVIQADRQLQAMLKGGAFLQEAGPTG